MIDPTIAPLLHTARVLGDIETERRRQLTVEGWTPEHDDTHVREQMAYAAACYAIGSPNMTRTMTSERFGIEGYDIVSASILLWPWARKWWKPMDRRRNLIKAAALLVAEIERLDRKANVSRETLEDANEA